MKKSECAGQCGGGHGSRIFNRLEQQQSGGSKKQEEADSCYKFPLSIVIITVVVVVQNHRSSRCLITADEFVFSQRSSEERERERGEEVLKLPSRS